MPDGLQRNYELARALVDALPADVGLTAAQFEAAAGQLLKRGYRLSADPVDEIVAEHALEMSGGGMHVRADGLDEVYPLDQWIADQQRHGARVHRRRVIVVDDWTKVPRG